MDCNNNTNKSRGHHDAAHHHDHPHYVQTSRGREPELQVTVSSGQTVTMDTNEHKNFALHTVHDDTSIILSNPTKPGRCGTVVITNTSTSNTCVVRLANERIMIAGTQLTMPFTIPALESYVLDYYVPTTGCVLVRTSACRVAPPDVFGYTSPVMYTTGVAVETPNAPLTTGAVDGFTIAPPLPAGLAL